MLGLAPNRRFAKVALCPPSTTDHRQTLLTPEYLVTIFILGQCLGNEAWSFMVYSKESKKAGL